MLWLSVSLKAAWAAGNTEVRLETAARHFESRLCGG